MRIMDKELWEVTSSANRDFKINNNEIGDVTASELYLNPFSDCTIVVKGYTDPSDTVGTILKATDIPNVEVKASVTTKGVYMYMTSSFYKVNVAVTGTSKIGVKFIY